MEQPFLRKAEFLHQPIRSFVPRGDECRDAMKLELVKPVSDDGRRRLERDTPTPMARRDLEADFGSEILRRPVVEADCPNQFVRIAVTDGPANRFSLLKLIFEIGDDVLCLVDG